MCEKDNEREMGRNSVVLKRAGGSEELQILGNRMEPDLALYIVEEEENVWCLRLGFTVSFAGGPFWP
jgi:hypothetical protein